MSNAIIRLFIKLQIGQLVVFALLLAVGLGSVIESSRTMGGVFALMARNDILTGDFRQAKVNLNAALKNGFESVEVVQTDAGRIIELHNEPGAFSWLKTFDYEIKVTDGAAHGFRLRLTKNVIPPLAKLSIFGLIVMLINTGVFFLIKSRLEKALSSRARDKRMRELGELAAGVAHDIRSPLSLVGVIAQRLRGQSPQMGEALEQARDRLEQIAADLLGRYRGDSRKIDVSEVLKKSVNELSETSKVVKIGTAQLTSEAFFVEADASQLHRAFSNLLNNAIEACPGDAGQVSVTSVTASSGLTIEIADNGSGIDSALLKKFHQGDFGVTTKANGNGLGLKNSALFFKSVGAKFDIDSQVGQGTKVSIRFSDLLV